MADFEFAWVRDRTTGNRFKHRKNLAEADPTLEILGISVDRKLVTRPTRQNEATPEPIVVVAPEVVSPEADPDPAPASDPDPEPKEG